MLNNDGNVFFIGDFDDNAEQNLIIPLTKEIQKQRRLRDGRIDLYINSYGGYKHLVFQLVSLVETAKREGIVVRTIVPHIAFSAGSILAVTGTPGERYIEKDAEHLLHYGTTGSMETTPEQVERNGAIKTRDFKKILAHYNKYSSVPDLATKMNDDSFFVPANKCLTWNLADKYMEKFDIGYDTRD
jgi:ATP-dependent protease ClpP protease subunit